MVFIKDYLLKDSHYVSLIGILAIFFIAFILSSNKKKIKLRRILSAFALQIFLAIFALNTEIGHKMFQSIADAFNKLNSFADEGIRFVFGNLIDPMGAWGFIFAVKVIPIIIFFGALTALLSHLRIIQVFVKAISLVVSPLIGTSGAETLCATGNSMLDPTASALLIKGHLKDMTDSEILTVMVCGMSTLTASLLAVYGSMGIPMLHLLAASFMSIPGALLISKILMPETKTPVTGKGKSASIKSDSSNILDAIASGTTTGLKVASYVAAMLIVFISLMAMVNSILASLTGYSLNDILSKLFYFVAYFIGIAKKDRAIAGALLGQKMVINEFVAYAGFAKAGFTERTTAILTYAICGFSNFSVIGMLIGGIGSMAPSKREFITKYGLKALLGGTLVNLLNAAIVSLLI